MNRVRRFRPFKWGLALAVLVLSRGATGQIPLLGRFQDFSYSAADVELQASLAYSDRLASLRSRGRLDDDPEIGAQIRRIAPGLIRQAILLKPEAAAWHWEIHTTGSGDEEASSMAGGKLLFGSAFIRRLHLADGELATLIAHEIAHTIAEHQRETLSQVFYMNSATIPLSVSTAMARLDSNWSLEIRLSKLSRMQESEADQLGMTLAHLAGWRPQTSVSFYRKLDQLNEHSLLDTAYPTPAARLNMAETMARWFQGSAVHANARSTAPTAMTP